MYVTVDGYKIWVPYERGEETGPLLDSMSHANQGGKEAVLLLHGFPDTGIMWQSQVQALKAAGYCVIAPDMLGFGKSDKPEDTKCYRLRNIARQLCCVLDELQVSQVSVVGHDFGAAAAWTLAIQHSARVKRLCVLSVGHPGVAVDNRQRAHWWYMLFFTLPEAEEVLAASNWQLFRQVMEPACHSSKDVEHYVQQLAQPGALRGGLNWYKANTKAAQFGQAKNWKVQQQLQMPVLGIWSDQDTALLEPQMANSAEFVAAGQWKYVRLEGVGHWIPRQAPHVLNQLLLKFMSEDIVSTTPGHVQQLHRQGQAKL
eukprot:gene9420-9585_t